MILAPCSHVFCCCFFFQSCLALKRELVYMLLVHLYVYLACVASSSFSLRVSAADSDCGTSWTFYLTEQIRRRNACDFDCFKRSFDTTVLLIFHFNIETLLCLLGSSRKE